jgi:hypothetical protein
MLMRCGGVVANLLGNLGLGHAAARDAEQRQFVIGT